MAKTKCINLDEFPMSLDVSDISKILRLSKFKTYELCHRADFPSIIMGRRIFVPKPAFVKWLEDPK